MKITNLTQFLSNFAKLSIAIYLLQMSLSKALRIILIIFIRPI